ncbi:MAG: hypothetical protein ACOC56_01390 [Atribacterota bacterium]
MFCDFTTTACIRPAIIRKCYRSFYDRLKGIDFDKCTLYINIDPVPEKENAEEVIRVAEKFFGNVFYNTPEEPNFSLALKWCWQNTTSDYVFHLEDDWELVKEFRVAEVLKYFSKNNYRKNVIKSGRCVKKKIIGITPRAYGFTDNRLGLTPTLFDGSFIRKVAKRLKKNKNPERCFRKMYAREYGQRHYPDKTRIKWVKDIGRDWLEAQDYIKNKKYDWVMWRKK